MECDCCTSSNKLEKLLTFLGIHMCFRCAGKGLITKNICCCERETVTCPECKGNEFIIENHSILKSFTNDLNEDDELEEIGLCD